MRRQADILVVDDNENNLVSLEAALADLGENIIKASSGREALRRLLDQDFAVILMDIQMPEMDGFETASLIRGREKTRTTPIIFLTAFNRGDAEVYQGYSMGAVDFLFKPIVREVLQSKVAVFVELYRKTEEVKRQAQLLRDAERLKHQRKLTEAKQRWEADSLRESNQHLQLLATTANRLLLTADPLQLIPPTYDEMSRQLGLDLYLHYVVDGRDDHLTLVSHAGVPDDCIARIAELPFGASLAGAVALERRPILLENVQQSSDPRADVLRPLGITALACFPLIAHERLIGTLEFGTRARTTLKTDELALMTVTCDQLAMSLDRARLIAELRGRNLELAEADRRKDEFLAMLAHELRNPLAPILTAIGTLKTRSDDNPVMARAEAAMERQVNHMVRLVDDLLDVARITNGKIELRREPLDITGIVEQAVQSLRPLVESRGHHLEVSLPPEPIALIADPTRLTQVVANLVNNAAKYTDPGGKIWVSSAATESEVVIRVKDTGRGVPTEKLPHIFDLFVQLDASSDRKEGGLGLGLTLVKQLVAMHGGTVEAFSDGEGRGTEFIVKLPLSVSVSDAAPLLVPAPPPAAPEKAERPEKLRVLLIEDNIDVRETLGDLLQIWGHDVDIAVDGAEGIAKALEVPPNVAIIDIGLPGIDGYSVARRLREAFAAAATDNNGHGDGNGNGFKPARTWLIAMTGYGQPEDKRRAIEAGFDHHLVKPVDLDSLSRLLAETGSHR